MSRISAQLVFCALLVCIPSPLALAEGVGTSQGFAHVSASQAVVSPVESEVEQAEFSAGQAESSAEQTFKSIKAFDSAKQSGSPFDGAGPTSLSDGTYEMSVEMSGGTGKVSLVSPCTVTVKDNKAYARIEWSSPNYDYMVVEGYIFYALSNDETSVFEIPIVCYDEGMEVVGDTLAMSEPHEITYTLVFDEGSATPVAKVSPLPFIAICAVAVIAVVAAALVFRAKKKRKGKR